MYMKTGFTFKECTKESDQLYCATSDLGVRKLPSCLDNLAVTKNNLPGDLSHMMALILVSVNSGVYKANGHQFTFKKQLSESSLFVSTYVA